jgi:hypothetical protein
VTPEELAPLLLTAPSPTSGIDLLVDRERAIAFVQAEAGRIDRAPVEAGFDVPQPGTVDTQAT